MQNSLRQIFASVIVFTLAAPACAEEDTLYEVVKVAQGDVLYLRAAPDSGAAIVGAIPYDGGAVRIIEAPKPGSTWAKIRHGDLEGYANATFLAPQQPLTGELPASLKCGGTEPFWSYTRDAGNATYEPMEGEKTSVALKPVTSGANRPNIWVLEPSEPNRTLIAFISENRVCSDGMSDTFYRYEIFLRTGDQLLSGCCNAQ
jgi:uncharacterized membrane protein